MTLTRKQVMVAAVYAWLDTLSEEEVSYLCSMLGGISCVQLCALAGVGEE